MKKDMELDTLLKQYTPPEINETIRKIQVRHLSEDIQSMDYLPPQSYTGQILTQLSFISGWVWLVQAGILVLLFYYIFRANPLQINMMMFCVMSELSLILVYEISKSFRMNIWEMESACRYNLAQIFFFRLCILFGGDFVVLTGALIAYRMVDGPLWQFCFYAVLPFFLTNTVSLYTLRRIGNRCNAAVAAAIPLLACILVFWALSFIDAGLSHIGISLAGSIPLITILAFVPLLYNAMRLCTDAHYLNEKLRKTA